MQFNRPPRLQKTIPQEQVKVPETPPLPQKPEGNNWLGILLPVGGMLLAVAMMSMIGGGRSSISYLMMLPLMLASSLGGVFATRSQKKKYENGLKEARNAFRNSLRSVEERLSLLWKNELAIRTENDPSPEECISRALRADSKLGERRPKDADFLHLRCGLGGVPASFSIDAEYRREKQIEFTEEYKFIDDLSSAYSRLKDAPISVDLQEIGSLGISGQRIPVLDTARALVIQMLTNQWIDEVRIGILAPDHVLPNWSWTEDLPQMSPIMKISKSGNQLNDRLAALEREMQQRRQQEEADEQIHRKATMEEKELPLPRLVIIIDSLPEGFSHSALDLLAKQGKDLGVFCIYLCARPELIPGSCGGALLLNGQDSLYRLIGEEGRHITFRPDAAKQEQAAAFAKAMKEIEWPGETNASRPPDMFTFLEMFGVKRVEDLPITDWWENGNPYGYLRAPLGAMSSTSNFIFDLNDADGAHGPHGLLGGMTGSGKSEVLKTMILSLALLHHPYDLNFALIDFKGGAAFNELASLPHTVGVVTDIESNATFAERVIQALNGEIQRRKVVLERARAVYHFNRPHIDEYRKLKIRQPLPRLLIVFDEFAEFKQRNPNESKKLISIARQGRSLGVHLLLATQNISAAVDPEIMQNSTYKICLRMASAQDSMQMIGIPDAITLTRGRAYFSADTRVMYQSAFSGADYYPDDDNTENNFVRIWPDGRKERLMPPSEGGDFGPRTISEAQAVIDAICKTAEELNLKHPPAVWPDSLPEKLFLPDLLNNTLTGGWDGHGWQPCCKWGEEVMPDQLTFPYLGINDFPEQQQQLPFCADMRQGCNMLIFGSAGTGKSTMLKTLISSLALTNPPDAVNIYALDYGGQTSLKVMEDFPHVGSVVTRIETEKTERLIQMLHKEVFKRNELLRDKNVDNRVDYNALVEDDEKLPAIYLLIDNFGNLRRNFEPDFIQSITALMNGGQSAGIYLVISSGLQGDVPNEMFANVNNRLTFLQADTSEYFRIVGHPSEAKMEEDAIKGIRPGRGLLRGTQPIEFQTALPAYGTNDREQLQNLMALSQRMKEVWKGKLPPEVRTLPTFVKLPEDFSLNKDGKSVYGAILGLNFEWLDPVGFSLLQDGPVFMIASSASRTGRTTLLRTWLLEMCENYTEKELQIYLLDFHSRNMLSFRNTPQVNYVGSYPDFDVKINELKEEIARRDAAIAEDYEKDPDGFSPVDTLRQFPHIIIAADNYESLHQKYPDTSDPLAECLQKGGELGCSFIITAKLTELASNYEDRFVAQFRKRGTGILLGGAEGIDEFNNTRRPQGAAPAGLPAGRGFLISRGTAGLLQTFTWWDQEEDPEDVLMRRLENVKK